MLYAELAGCAFVDLIAVGFMISVNVQGKRCRAHAHLRELMTEHTHLYGGYVVLMDQTDVLVQ